MAVQAEFQIPGKFLYRPAGRGEGLPPAALSLIRTALNSMDAAISVSFRRCCGYSGVRLPRNNSTMSAAAWELCPESVTYTHFARKPRLPVARASSSRSRPGRMNWSDTYARKG